ncbi:MAG: hypothetical protein HKN88_00355 [Gammaproteobacteria bacterium]|nr:hypothetical protein [Gammaproteobacteria bacterium]NNC96501.1 hypothetical protein [Gammaproteobacteria bacterium]NNM14715.1 hypothetical protein [Gammaproteobacteria bacterium]
MIQKSLLIGLILLASVLMACAQKADLTDPEYVAEAFWSAIQEGNAVQAITFIHPDAREQLGKQLKTDMRNELVPELPEELVFEMFVKGDVAVAKIRNSKGVACDLVKDQGRWWVR